MTVQISSSPVNICNFMIALPESICASSRDYGFDFDEDELARELIAPLPNGLSMQTFSEVGADDFEKVFHYFLS